MESRNKRTRVVSLSILGVALAFQLYAVPYARGQDDDGIYNDGKTYDVSDATYYSAFLDGEGTIVNFNATIPGGINIGWNSPGATLNFGADASAFYIDATTGSYTNLYGGSVGFAVFVYLDAQVTVHGDTFEVDGTQYGPGTTLHIPYSTLTAYSASGVTLFTGPISCVEGATVLLGAEAEDPDIDVQIDVKPGSDPSIINLRSKGLVPVAVLSDETFDATQVLPETVLFAGAGVVKRRNGKYMAHAKDVDEDGDDDMLFHFRKNDLELEDGVTEVEVTLTGQLTSPVAVQSIAQVSDGTPISGTDNVLILRPKKRGHRPFQSWTDRRRHGKRPEPVSKGWHKRKGK